MSNISQTSVRSRRPQGKIGARVTSSVLDRILTLINKDPQAYQVTTIVVATNTNSFLYKVSVGGTEVQYQADATATKAEISAGLKLAIDTSPGARGLVSCVDDTIDTVTCTALYPGMAVAIVETDTGAKLTITDTVAAATADSVAFGRAMIKTAYQTDEANLLGVKVTAAKFTAQVITLTPVFNASNIYYTTIWFRDVAYIIGDVAAATNTATDTVAIAAAINAKMPASTVIATSTATTVVLTSEVPGEEFTVDIGTFQGDPTKYSQAATTGPSVATSLNRAFCGVSMWTMDEADVTIAGNDAVYPANAGVKVLQTGQIWVQFSGTPALGAAVYVETVAGATAGRFYDAVSSTRVLLKGAVWERASRTSNADSMAVLNLIARSDIRSAA